MTFDWEKTSRSTFFDENEDQPRHWARPALLLAVACFVFANFLFMHWYDYLPKSRLAMLWLGMVPLHAAALGGALWSLHNHRPAGRRAAALDLSAAGWRRMWRNWPRKLSLVGAIYGGALAVSLLTGAVLHSLGYETPPMELLEILHAEPSPALVVSVVLAAVVVAPVSEEILFRVVLFDALRGVGIMFAAFVSSLVFALAHGSPMHAPALFFLGLVLQGIRLRAGLWPCMVCHSLFNAGTFVILGLWLGLAGRG